MDSYNFTYKDVLKRYERIINKPSKFEIRLLATILLIITIVNITSLCFAAEVEEEVQISNAYGLTMQEGSNVFIGSTDTSVVSYVQMEKGYIYTLTIPNTFTVPRIVGYSDDIPSLNGNYTFLASVSPGTSYSYSFDEDVVLYFDFAQGGSPLVTRRKIASQESAVDDLVENVGISQIWDVFDTGIGFVGVVVLVAFGIFLVVIAIRKMQKGKSEF